MVICVTFQTEYQVNIDRREGKDVSDFKADFKSIGQVGPAGEKGSKGEIGPLGKSIIANTICCCPFAN